MDLIKTDAIYIYLSLTYCTRFVSATPKIYCMMCSKLLINKWLIMAFNIDNSNTVFYSCLATKSNHNVWLRCQSIQIQITPVQNNIVFI